MKESDTSVERRKWYNGYKFPIVPAIEIKKGDEYSTNGFSFHWLFFKAWSLDCPEFELSIVCSSHWGIGVIGILPYLRWCICVPLPEKIGLWVYKVFARKPSVK